MSKAAVFLQKVVEENWTRLNRIFFTSAAVEIIPQYLQLIVRF